MLHKACYQSHGIASTGASLLVPGSEVIFQCFDLLEYQIHTISPLIPASSVIGLKRSAEGKVLKRSQQSQALKGSGGFYRAGLLKGAPLGSISSGMCDCARHKCSACARGGR